MEYEYAADKNKAKADAEIKNPQFKRICSGGLCLLFSEIVPLETKQETTEELTFQIKELNQDGRCYRLSKMHAVLYANIKPHKSHHVYENY